MRSFLKRWIHILIPAVILLFGAGLKFFQFDFIEDEQNLIFDQFQRRKPRQYEPIPVRIVDIDDESLARLGQWPWPRTKVAEMVDRLRALGAKAIAFDIVFAEADRTSPVNVIRQWPQTPETAELRASAERLPDHDQILARAISKAPVVAGYVLIHDHSKEKPNRKAKMLVDVDSTWEWLGINRFMGALTNIPAIEKAAPGNGNFSFEPERDGVIRRVPLLFGLHDPEDPKDAAQVLPSLSLEALRLAYGADQIIVRTRPSTGVRSISLRSTTNPNSKEFVIPTDENGRVLLYDSGPRPERSVAAWKVLDKKFDAEIGPAIRGSIVYIGTSAPGLMDLRSTPLQRAAAGVGLHAQITEQILLGKFLHRPGEAIDMEAYFILFIGAALIFLLPRAGAAWCGIIGAGAALGAWAVSWYGFSVFGYLIEPFLPTLTLLLVYLSSSLISYIRTEADKRQIRGAFAQYLSPVLVEQLADHPEKLVLGGEMKEMTLLFTDIRGFTTISEKFADNPHGLTQLINGFLTPMTDVVLSHNGTVDKYMGDCIMAFWNAPLDDPKHAANACRAALEMQRRLLELNKRSETRVKKEGGTYVPIHTGVGINTGICCVGNMGSQQRFDYSVLGDDVNLASRLEGQSKTYGVEIVVGENTREKAPGFSYLELDLIRVKGKTKPVRIYTLLGEDKLQEEDTFRNLLKGHDELLAAYREQEWQDAVKLLSKVSKLACAVDGGLDLERFYKLYAERIKAFRLDPPGKNWDGVFIATTK